MPRSVVSVPTRTAMIGLCRRWPATWSPAGYGWSRTPATGSDELAMLSVDRPPPPGRVRGHLGDGRHDGWRVNMTDIQLPDVFVEMADTLVADFDVLDFMHLLTDRCTALLAVPAPGLLLRDPRATLRFAAASTEAGRLLELFQLQVDEGPCLDCFHTGQRVMVADIATATHRWPPFAPVAASHGYAAVCALPVRLRSEGLGGRNLFVCT